ncbi:lysosome-associated membrane glycoprotein 5 [Neocloeon triangulifer]|uniref:lysosome-associated membrane glycoprotein 5 n=1 Tax=Neocloeon triangulifer TaxID=2078957 RepID=UPI00286F75BB|nr:lysosome-associated membrane glycoprotein 5 [Neocloeon triangulifer]
MEHTAACSLLLLLAIGVAVAQQKVAPSPAEPVTTDKQQSSGSDKVSFFRSQNQNLKTSAVTGSTPTAVPEGGTAIYRQYAKDGTVCTLIRTDGLLTFTYVDKIKEKTETDVYLPNEVTVSGHCHLEDSSLLTMRWKSYILNWFFMKTPGGERWYLDRLEVKFNTSEKKFEHYPKPGRAVRLSTPAKVGLFPTPVGKAYECNEEETIQLEGGKDISASILLRDLKIQPFIFKGDDFGPEFICQPGAKSYRDERAPLAVGTTLAVVTLLTVAGYGVYRYIKIKKVQYDNVE